MRKILTTLSVICMYVCLCDAQVGSFATVPDIKYHASGQRQPWKLSNDGILFTILEFQDDNDTNKELSAFYTDDGIKPFFQNYDPDYGRTLAIVSSMVNRKGIERKLSISEHPYYVLVGPDPRILTRSNSCEAIIDYVTANLSAFAATDWEAVIIKAIDLFEKGQVYAAQRIVSDFLSHGKWNDNYSPEVHKAIPRIVASMKQNRKYIKYDDMYWFYVGEIKRKYNKGILSEEDITSFKNEFSSTLPK